MKKLILYLILIFSFVGIKAQNYSIHELMFQPKNKLVKSFNKRQKNKIKEEINQFQERMKIEYKDQSWAVDEFFQYRTDTFAIELIERERVKKKSENQDVVLILEESKNLYDALLNKYYKLARTRLNQKDKELIRLSQLNWIKLRDSEEALCKSLLLDSENKLDPFCSKYGKELIKQRVYELFDIWISPFTE